MFYSGETMTCFGTPMRVLEPKIFRWHRTLNGGTVRFSAGADWTLPAGATGREGRSGASSHFALGLSLSAFSEFHDHQGAPKPPVRGVASTPWDDAVNGFARGK